MYFCFFVSFIFKSISCSFWESVILSWGNYSGIVYFSHPSLFCWFSCLANITRLCNLMKNPKWNGYNYSIWTLLLRRPKGFLYIMTFNVRESDLLYFTAWRGHRTCKITTFIIRQNILSQVTTIFWYFQGNLSFFLIHLSQGSSTWQV